MHKKITQLLRRIVEIYMLSKDFQAFKFRWQEGHKRRPQNISEDNSLSKCFLSWSLKSILFLRIFTFSFLNSNHVLGKLTSGCLDKDASLVKGTVRSLLLRRMWWEFSGLLASLVVHTLLKEIGNKPWIKFCMNWRLKNSINLSKGKIPSSLKIGSVCSLYLEPLTNLIAFFCIKEIFLINFWEQQLQMGTQYIK